MPVNKIDPKVIFASNAPAIDKPPVFSDKTKGWDVARLNDGRPTIKEMNKVQQDTDLKILWLNENSVTPYDESIDYPDGAVAIKDGSFKQLVSGAWVDFLDDFADKDEVKRRIAKVEAIDELRLLNSANDGDTVYVKSYTAGNNVGGGVFLWDSISTVPDNGVNTFAVTGITTGRWVRPLDVVITPHHAGAVDGTDSSDALDRFAAFVLSDAGKSLVEVVGNFNISRPFPFDYTGQINTMHWDLELKALNGMRYMIAIKGGGVQHDGSIRLVGTGSVNRWETFTVEYGCVLNGVASCNLPFIRTSFIKYYGVLQDQNGEVGIIGTHNNTTTSMDGISGRDCGCVQTAPYSNHRIVDYTYSNPVHTGSSGTTGQRTTIDVSGIPYDAGLVGGTAYVVINNITYRVQSADFANNKISIFPWLESAEPTSGTLQWVFGGAFFNGGNNSGPTNLKSMDVIRCAIGIHDACLYGATATSITSQFCGIGVLLGIDGSSASPQTSSYTGVYTESVYRNMVYVGSGSSTFVSRYGAFFGASFVNCERITANNRTGDYGANADILGMSRISMPNSTGVQLYGQYYKGKANNRDAAAAGSITQGVDNLIPRIYKRDTWIINLTENLQANKNKGLEDSLVGFVGNGVNGSPSGSMTFNPPSGWTVNAGSSAVFSNFTQPPMFACYWEYPSKNIVVRNLTGALSNSVTYDPPSIPAGATTATTVTLTGATIGSVVQAAFSQYSADIEITAQVSAINTVTVKFKNTGGGAVDLASGTLTVKLI